MATEQITFEQQLAKLKAEYLLQLPQQLANIRADWNSFIEQNSIEKMIVLHRNVHSLIGTSGTFGFMGLSKKARDLETQLKPLTDTDVKHNTEEVHYDPEFIQHINSTITELFLILQSIQKLPVNIDASATKLGDQLSSYISTGNSGTSGENTIIYYVDDELTGPSLLTQQLSSYGFKVTHFRSMQAFLAGYEKQKPHLILFDLIMPDTKEEEIFSHAKAITNQGIKVIFLSGKGSFESRLAGVRSGAYAYLLKPADVPMLVELIRSALQMNINKPAHILIVDDQESVAKFYSRILTQAGMKTTVETNAFNTLNLMQANMPDLLLLDLNMPNVTGDELAAIIRQQEQYQSIPILFLSAENSPERKTSLLEIGSDDLLSKGISPEVLVRQVKSRVERARILTSMMYQDSLTGLLNHAQIQLAADRTFSTCKRHHTQFCIAMIDIDYFKKVNDTHGHLTGDRVIKALAHLLEQRFRLTDYVGRFGGEEFMLVLPDITVNDASKLINTLRKAFADIEFKEDDVKFTVSFSAGVAENTGMNNFIEQIKCADEALYRAKERGRNVVCANLTSEIQ